MTCAVIDSRRAEFVEAAEWLGIGQTEAMRLRDGCDHRIAQPPRH
jgi:LmbE family N-acetylglucosaminyl deacetylase